ncbi:hypothetical protein T484DRAFT_3584002 [Baffinella frigidus]|nr:hypothetical protein T484DRAFT_3584002 [Cryptophyta sp. CCMP2293]
MQRLPSKAAAEMLGLMLVLSSTAASAFSTSSVCGSPSLACRPLSARSSVNVRGSACIGTLSMGYPPEITYGKLPGAEGGGAKRVAEAWGGGQIALSQPAPRGAELQGSSRLFLDTADVAEYSVHLPLGIFYGVTSNPTLLERAGVECSVKALRELARAAFSLGAQEFMCQAWGEGVGDLVERGRQLAAIDARVVVKVPLTAAGVQVFTSIAAGAEYVAPYVGRMTDNGVDGVAAVASMNKIVAGSGSRTRVLVASVRSAEILGNLAALGCNTFTISPQIARELVGDPATIKAAAEFEEAARRKQENSRGNMGFSI